MFQPISPKALQLIRQGQQFDPSYQDGLSNHLPMALAALSLCGATDSQLETFYRDYTPRLEPIRQLSPPPKSSIAVLGNNQHFPDFLVKYRQLVEQKGLEEAVIHALPQLLPGVATAAFHALIRLSYAVQIQDKEETAIALAYWASEFQPLGPLQVTTKYRGETQLKMAFERFNGYPFQPGNIVDRIDELITTPEYHEISANPTGINLDCIARSSIQLYLASGNFTLLHGVTGLQALHVLMPLIEHKDLAVNYFWQAYIAALCASRADTISPSSLRPLASPSPIQWRVWLKQVQTSKNDHDIKLIYSCAYLYQYFPCPEYPSAVDLLLARFAA